MTYRRDLYAGQDTINFYEITERISDLESAEDLDEDESAELDVLQALLEEIPEDETLIADSYFKEYAQELAEDIGAIGPDNQWPLTCIDWDQAANDLKMDYTSYDFQGVTYWARA